MRYFKLFLLLSAFAFGGALIGAQSANASSIYDDIIRTTDKVEIGWDSNGCSPIDITDTWASVMSGSSGTIGDNSFVWLGTNAIKYPDMSTSWNARNSWGVTNVTNNGDKKTAIVWYVGTFVPDVNFYDYGSVQQAWLAKSGQFVNYFEIHYDKRYHSSCTVYVDNAQQQSDNTIGGVTIGQNPVISDLFELFFAYNVNVIYPPNYEGSGIPDAPPIPIDYTDWTPDWYVSFGFDYEVTIHDTNFNTFDDNPFLCESGLAPAITWEIKNSSDTVLYSGIQSPTMQIVRKLPVSSQEQTYTISGIYNCGEDDLQFNQYGTLEFTLTDTGLLVQPSVQDCFQGDFPFTFDINACMTFFSPIFNLLSFGQITLGESWNYGNTGCGYFTVIDDWLGLPDGTQICPQFSSTIRNAVTPFLSVILGLITLTFLARLDNNRGGI